MEFEWDNDKSDHCLAQRGFEFSDVVPAFFDPSRQVTEDTRRDYGERQFRLFGRVGTRLVVVVYTMRGSLVRIISARKANQREVNYYEKNTH